MATPSSGEFKLQDIVTEFGGDAPHGLTEYYAVDLMWVLVHRTLKDKLYLQVVK